ncbi:hypothetical protein SUGI_1002870 [Cryptomeria japonica]|uniref:transcription factor MYB1 n=1 Tax=Cryptomeria japonica TaxID=3369 RepID=UPI0024147C78|nr:transcription factor MYB1 [Cryptomeria japonica]GLJ47504.1 hypothetical protein SUGI_1002870 [Cryptomeria japonica]
MCRSPRCSKHSGINRGTWTAEEDLILRQYVSTHGAGEWMSLPSKAGLKRCGRSCRLRWLNYLRPDIKRGNISPDEDDLILRLHRLLGNRWSLIAGRLPGRTDNEIKNHWITHLGKKSLPRKQILAKPNTTSNLTPPHDDQILQYTPIRATPVRLSNHQDFNPTDVANNYSQLGSPSMQIIDNLSPSCIPNLVDSPFLPYMHCIEEKSASFLYSYELQSADSDLLWCPYYSFEDFTFEEFLATPGNNLEGQNLLHGQDKSFTVSDGQGMEGIYNCIQQHDCVNELQYF